MPDRCQQFEQHLDAWVAGMLDTSVRATLQAHVDGCERCTGLLAVVQGDDDALGAADSFLNQVLRETSGRACEQSQSLLCDLVDGLLPETESVLVRDHMQHCRSCTSIAQSLVLLRHDLSSLDALVPDDDFVDDVLAATSGAAPPEPSWLDRMADTWNRLLQRPRFAWEVAWLGTAVLMLLMGSPRSPLRDVPQNALAIVQTNPTAAWTAMQPGMERAWGWVRDDLQGAWGATGGKVIDAANDRRDTWVEDHPQAEAAWNTMQGRMPTLRQAIADGNLAQVSWIVTELGDDLQDLWHGFRAAPDDSLGSSTPPDEEEI